MLYEDRTSTGQAAGFGSIAKHALVRRIMGQRIGALPYSLRAAKAGGAP